MATVSGKGLNIFTGAVNSNFSDLRNWSQQRVPSGSDTAIVAANCTFDSDRVLGALIVNPNATASIGSGRTLIVNGTLNVQGHLSASGNPNIYLRGAKNIINSFSPGTSTTYYDNNINQIVARGTYHNLVVTGTGTKTLTGDTTLNGNLTSNNNGNLELSRYNLTVTGTSTLQGTGTIYPLQKSGPGTVIFGGAVSTGNNTYVLDFSVGNPTVEVRSGMTTVNQTATTFKCGTGTWSFTTNNQTLTFTGGSLIQFEGAVNIGSGITLTVSDGAGGGNSTSKQLILNSTLGINGLSAGSTLVIGNNCGIRINQPGTTLMSTGVFTPSTNSTSLFQINYTGDSTIPYTSFGDLSITNIGTKTLAGNTTVNNLTITNGTSSKLQLECSVHNLTINGTTNLANPAGSTDYVLSKTGPGSVLFTGLLTLSNNATRLLDFSTGNPSVELRGGIATTNPSTTLIKTGTGTWSFTTNNQNITSATGGSGTLQFDATILISGAITVSHVNNSSIPFTVISTGKIDGNNVSSKFLMGAGSTGTNTINYQSATQPMVTGLLDVSSSLNTFIYERSGSQNIAGGTYRNLTIAGSGSKTLMGNVSVLNTLVTGSLITLITGSYTLTNP